jgi:glycine cleavage system H protein
MDESTLLYAATHEWAQVDGTTCTVGITRFAVEQLTDIVYIELPPVGKEVAQGATFGVIESVKAVSDLYAPVAGKVVAVNTKVADDPSLLNDDPYEKGWLIKLEVAGAIDKTKLLSKSQYDAQAAAEH